MSPCCYGRCSRLRMCGPASMGGWDFWPRRAFPRVAGGGGRRSLGWTRTGRRREAARALEARWPGQFWWQQRNFRELKTCTHEHGWEKVDGVLLDLGVSSPQLETAARGFSFQAEGPLDMRMDQRSGPTAADLVNELSEAELTKLFYEQGGEREARKVARAVVARRSRAPLPHDARSGNGCGANPPAPPSSRRTSGNAGSSRLYVSPSTGKRRSS